MINLYKKDKLQVLVGRVESVNFIENGDRTAVVRLVDRTGDKVDIYFKNDKSTPENPKMLADRIESAKVSEGKWLTVKVMMDDKATKATGLEFKYHGLWTFDQSKDEEGSEKPKVNIAVGYSAKPKRVNDDLFKVSMAEKVYDKTTEQEDTRWFSISFFNDEKELMAKMAENMLSLSGEQKSVPCAIRCSSLKEKEKDGKTYYNLTGYRIELMVDNEAKTTSAEKAA
ncbi:MAG: hypothetical protein LBI03_06250 [Clostridiales bacterium]|jgi:hypothetical protein|nr:hypothetical protein [Clostridiales bacterium]